MEVAMEAEVAVEVESCGTGTTGRGKCPGQSAICGDCVVGNCWWLMFDDLILEPLSTHAELVVGAR